MNRQTLLSAVAMCAWSCVIAVGFGSVWSYASRPGDPGREVARWPANRRVALDPVRGNLLLFLHPRCPCSRATLAELARLLPRLEDRVAVTIVFSRPKGMPAGWERGALWSEANAIPGARVIADPGGRLTALFGAETSGQAALYDARGWLLYRGGLTPGRGHEGDNFGSRTIAVLAQDNAVPLSIVHGAVFGCALYGRRRDS